MLAAHEEAGAFGNEPVFAMSEPVKRLAPGSQVGVFRIDGAPVREDVHGLMLPGSLNQPTFPTGREVLALGDRHEGL